MKGSPDSHWAFLTNHTHVLVVLEREPDARIRDIAAAVHITERAVQRILAELTHDGFVKVRKDGRRNTYHITRSKKLRHDLEKKVTVGTLLDTLSSQLSGKSGS